MPSSDYDLVIAGAGPAGCAAAIPAARAGARVLLLERGRYPRHKVCGEFVSPDALVLLRDLAGTPWTTEAEPIRRARLFLDGRTLEIPMTAPAASITRFHLDAALWHAAQTSGAECRQSVTVQSITRSPAFAVATSAGTFAAKSVIVAAGRWSNLQHTRAENLDSRIGLKAHFLEHGPSPAVDLYFFPAGYCGVQPIGSSQINVCAMVRADAARTIPEMLALHPQLQQRSRHWLPLSAPVTTAPLVLRRPVTAEDGILYAGDAAGFVDPFLGDGIALALRSGAMAAAALDEFWRGCAPLSAAVARYRENYQREIRPVFRAAFLLRTLVDLPSPLRRIVAGALRTRAVAGYVMAKTRCG